ncbi:MAG: hypothetical protein GY696_03105 [Gammaproteobacteria bacterium]|nr:hypothetical protein [Gammaproteobacteria bacterium]
MNRCAYTAPGTQDQNEIAAADVFAEASNVTRPFCSIYPCMSISKWQLNYPPQPKPIQTAAVLDSYNE